MENTQDQSTMIKEISSPLHESKGWMKFLGILSIIYGVFLALTLVGIVIAWLPIWLGILIYNAATAIENAHVTGDKFAFLRSMNQLKTYFIINGVLALIGIIFTVIAFAMGLIGALYSFLHLQ